MTTTAEKLTLLNNTKTAIKTAIEAKGVTVGSVPFADYATKIGDIPSGTTFGWTQSYYDAIYASGPASWVREPSWLALPTVNNTEHKFVGLHQINTDSNFVSLSAAGAYTVNWGDGIVENYATGITAEHQYDFNNANLANTDAPVTLIDAGDLISRNSHGYSNGQKVKFYNIVNTTGLVAEQTYYVINSTTNTFQVSLTAGGTAVALTTNGTANLLPYKQAIITVTPQVGQSFTSINLNYKHSQANLQAYTSGWLDIIISGVNLSSITISASSQSVNHRNLKRAQIISNTLVNDYSYMFSACNDLEVVACNIRSTGTVNLNSMFYECYSLKTIPLLNTVAVTNMYNMFGNCQSLKTIPLLNTVAVTSMANMFIGCQNLETIPLLNTANVISMSGMFSGCSRLQTIPLIDTTKNTSMSTMFSNCYSLKTIPLLNTAAVTDMNSTFTLCSSLETIPALNTSNVTIMSNLFANCYSLKEIPLIDTSKVTTMGGIFQNCSSLETIPALNTSNVTAMTNIFNGCTSLKEIPLINTSKTTALSFSNCRNLKTIPLLDTSSLTSMTNMFNACYSLEEIPLIDTSKVTNMQTAFANCYNLQKIPQLVTTAVTSSTNFGSMFTGCRSLSRIQAKNFRFTFSIANCKLSATALNEIYTNLPTVTGQTISVTGNWGTATDDPTIATAKGWTVSG